MAGLLHPRAAQDDPGALASTMAATLEHRGPDSSGAWGDPVAGVGLGHTRLAIRDLSAEGHQPMCSASGRYVIAYNGEIYDLDAARSLLARHGSAPRWRGRSDTEVLLAAIEAWGVRGAIARLNGMFAFAVWDRDRRVLTLVRDRLGIKPLYYGHASDGALLFGSELRALLAYRGFEAEIDRRSVARMLRFGVVPAPWSIYTHARKLPPGTLLEVNVSGGRVSVAEPETWWSAASVLEDARRRPFAGDVEAAVDELERMLVAAVSARVVADVPVGALLSGGVDSSTVVAVMQASSSRPVHTFTAGSSDPLRDESRAAARVAAHLGAEHTRWEVTARDALEVVPGLADVYDEPFADPSQVPTLVISRLARQQVTVALTGDGGDELFAGYRRHLWARRLERTNRWLPRPARRLAARGLLVPPPAVWDRAFAVMTRRGRQRPIGEGVQKAAQALRGGNTGDVYDSIVSLWPLGEMPVALPGDIDWTSPELPPGLRAGSPGAMQYRDLVGYLPDDVLTKVDRASMAHGLEARVPLLDHRVVEFALGLPPAWNLRGGGKWLLRQVLARHLPRELIEGPKRGFAAPVGQWLRGPLRAWAEPLLSPASLARDDLLDPAPILRRWREHLDGQRDWATSLWAVLMLQSWRGLG